MKKSFSLGLQNKQPIPKMLGVKGMNNHIMGGSKPIKIPNQNIQDIQILQETRQSNGRGVVSLTEANPWEVSYDFIRETNNIAANLPFALFGAVNSPTSYRKVFSQLGIVPVIAGVSGTVVFSYDDNGDLLFTWTLAGNTDILRITSKTLVDAATQLEMIRGGGSFSTSGFRFEADPVNYTRQFGAYNLMTAINSFGNVTLEQSTRMRANKGPDQFQNAILDVPAKMAVDQIYSVVGGCPYINGSTNDTYTWDFADVDFASGAIYERSNC